jgi:mannitol-specific phosphotransferase system IIBC component
MGDDTLLKMASPELAEVNKFLKNIVPIGIAFAVIYAVSTMILEHKPKEELSGLIRKAKRMSGCRR